MAQLFNPKLLGLAVEKFSYPDNEKKEKIQKIINGWQIALKDHNLDRTKETSIQGSYLIKIFCEILGYSSQVEGNEIWTLKQEAKTEVDGKEADGSLGFYTKNSSCTRAVIELKDAKCNLDSKQCSRENKQTPVEQAFQYLYKFADCDWVIVSNFRYTRLYHKSKGQTAYIEFDILNLHEEKEFKKFYYCLCATNLIDKSAKSPMDLLIKQSGEADIDITKEFYAEFKKIRKILFNHIVENNPDYDKKLLLEKTQKLLDRFIFIFFCEDTAGLLPHNTVENIYKMAQNSFSMSPCRIWEQFRGLFVAIDKGNNNVNPPINAYNGGLFAYDEILDSLIIKDEMFEHLKELSRYDFESDLNVNILGHIFEQSLSDLEAIKNELEGIEEDKKNSKRKKDGIFYTPEYITHYIVEETIGRYLDENPDKLETIKILDPACGSGAFLNQAHEYLRKRYQMAVEEKIATSKKNQLDLFKHTNQAENDRSILLNNIFGVDLNQESVEITKLALWLKTACQNYKLQNLDENIKCGNSLIDDETIAGNKAFKWENEFKSVIDNGGFDVIIGNPPYVNAKNSFFNDNEKNYFAENYETAQYQLDTYILFIEKSVKLLKENGYLGFIIPNAILNNLFIDKIRKFLLDNTNIQIIATSKEKIFEDAEVDAIVVILKKQISDSYDIEIGIFENSNYLLKHHCNKKIFKNNNSSIFSLNISNEKQLIINKIENNSIKTDKILSIQTGIKEYQVGKGKPPQSQADKDLLRFNANYKKDSSFIPELRGKNIGRYIYEWNNEYVSYGEWIAEPRNPKFFSGQRILLRKIPNKNNLVATSITSEFIIDQSLYIGLLNNTNFELNYVLGCINSKITCWYFKNINNEFDTLFPQIKINQFKQLPIPNISLNRQQSIKEKVNKIILLNKDLNETCKKSLELIELEYKPKKISQKLESFYSLGLNPFLEELQKQGVQLNLSQKEDLITWYKTKSELLNNIKSQIQSLDNEIDKEVYKLYGLDDEDVKIIEVN